MLLILKEVRVVCGYHVLKGSLFFKDTAETLIKAIKKKKHVLLQRIAMKVTYVIDPNVCSTLCLQVQDYLQVQ